MSCATVKLQAPMIMKASMKRAASVYETPSVPAIYAMYGGTGHSLYVAYVGAAGSLKTRLIQHFVRRDSSAVTGRSAVGLNPDFVTEVRWWERSDFSERTVLEAAELVAFDVLDPALKSRGPVPKQVMDLYSSTTFRASNEALFQGDPSGRLVVPAPSDFAVRISSLERRVDALEKGVKK